MQLSGLSGREQVHLLGLTSRSMELSKLRPHLESFYSRGSMETPYHRSAYNAYMNAENDEDTSSVSSTAGGDFESPSWQAAEGWQAEVWNNPEDEWSEGYDDG